MICNNCACQTECGWYKSYDKIETEVYLGIGTDNTLGRELLTALRNNQVYECSYYEDKEGVICDDGDEC